MPNALPIRKAPYLGAIKSAKTLGYVFRCENVRKL